MPFVTVGPSAIGVHIGAAGSVVVSALKPPTFVCHESEIPAGNRLVLSTGKSSRPIMRRPVESWPVKAKRKVFIRDVFERESGQFIGGRGKRRGRDASAREVGVGIDAMRQHRGDLIRRYAAGEPMAEV